MKKFLTSRIFAFFLGAIIFGSIGVVSAYTIFATDIGYTPKDATWKKSNGDPINNVDEALNELYNKATTTKVATQVATLTTQGASYTMQNDGYAIGTIQTLNLDTGAEVYFTTDGVKKAIARTDYRNSDVLNISLYIPKNTTISVRENGGTYNLTVYEWK